MTGTSAFSLIFNAYIVRVIESKKVNTLNIEVKGNSYIAMCPVFRTAQGVFKSHII